VTLDKQWVDLGDPSVNPISISRKLQEFFIH